ncbi:MAG: DsbA family protein [Candidatus Magasanikbacteria bacterium]|nr:DsbA family protein [Candidatus Magasanikbacteria bacterium]
MKKIVLWIILGLVLILLTVFGWRVWHYYQLIKSSGHFTKSQTAGSVSSISSVSLLRAGAPELGNPGAFLTIVEFADFSCSYSREVFPVMRELLAKYPDKIRLVFRFFPVDSSASQTSEEVAWAALCAAEQNKFWPFHDKLFQNQKGFTIENLKDYARQTGLAEAKFNSCLDSKKYEAAVRADFQDGLSAGVQGTPTFFVNGQKVEGAVPLEGWERLLKSNQ